MDLGKDGIVGVQVESNRKFCFASTRGWDLSVDTGQGGLGKWGNGSINNRRNMMMTKYILR